MADPMPPRSTVAPEFDGHLERPLLELTVAERLDWIWEGMQLLWLGRRARQGPGEEAQSADTREGDLGGAGVD